MAMKPIAVFALAAAFSLASAIATAGTVTNPPRGANEQSVNGVAGPPPARKVASVDDKSSAQPSKKVLKKTKVTPPPPLHDPNKPLHCSEGCESAAGPLLRDCSVRSAVYAPRRNP
jgi:hypothetical protein